MGRGSAGNVIAALASFFIPGLGQLLQGRFVTALFMFVLTCLMWLILLGWIIRRCRSDTATTGTAATSDLTIVAGSAVRVQYLLSRSGP